MPQCSAYIVYEITSSRAGMETAKVSLALVVVLYADCLEFGHLILWGMLYFIHIIFWREAEINATEHKIQEVS